MGLAQRIIHAARLGSQGKRGRCGRPTGGNVLNQELPQRLSGPCTKDRRPQEHAGTHAARMRAGLQWRGLQRVHADREQDHSGKHAQDDSQTTSARPTQRCHLVPLSCCRETLFRSDAKSARRAITAGAPMHTPQSPLTPLAACRVCSGYYGDRTRGALEEICHTSYNQVRIDAATKAAFDPLGGRSASAHSEPGVLLVTDQRTRSNPSDPLCGEFELHVGGAWATARVQRVAERDPSKAVGNVL